MGNENRDLGKFSFGKWNLDHWDGNHRQKYNGTRTGILRAWKINWLGNGTSATFGLRKWDLYSPTFRTLFIKKNSIEL